MTEIRYLRMSLHLPSGGKRGIGYLSQYGDILRASFDADYIADPQRPTLTLALRGATEADTHAILGAARDMRLSRSDGHWPSYFQNLLPEDHNRDRLALERRCSPDDEFQLLAAAGHDLMGAIEVEPVPLREGIPDIVRHWHTALGLDVLEPGFVEFPVEDAAALPGMVTKFSAVQDGRRYVVRRQGAAGSFILKLPSTRHSDLVANEAAGYQLCAALGLDCAVAKVISRTDTDLPEQLPFDDILAVRRFDRNANGQRVHIEEFAQVLQVEPKRKYGQGLMTDYPNMLRVIDRLSSRPAQDVQEFVKRFVSFVLMGNVDAHLKNWALMYPDGITPKLAPLYDPVCVTALFESVPPSDYAINRAIDTTLRAFDFIQLEVLLKTAGLQRVSRLVSIAKQTVKLAQADWPEVLKNAPPSVMRAVTERLAGGVALAC